MAKPPAPPPPPKAKPKAKQGNAYQQYIIAHPKLKPYAAIIYQSAVAEGIDPLYYAALLNTEYVPITVNGKVVPKTSSAGALGVAQIMPMHVGDYAPWLGRRLTAKDLNNQATNIRFGAYYFSLALKAHGGNYEAAYNNSDGAGGTTYNAGGPNPFAGLRLPPGGQYTSPEAAAQNALERGGAKSALTDPWAIIGKDGRLKYVNSLEPPKNAITYGGTPLTRSQFNSLSGQYNDQYLGYTGKNATPAQLAVALRKGQTIYSLQLQLAQTPAFRHSPIWKTRSGDYIAAWHAIYGPRSKPDTSAIGQAIVHNISGSAFQDQIRARADYVQSMEFKQNAVTMRQAYEQIYGPADQNANAAIRQATLNGWSPDQFQQYLRRLPEYSHTPEYHSKQITMLGALGMITGRVATMTPTNEPAAPQVRPDQPGKPGPRPRGENPRVNQTPQGPASSVPYDPRLKRAQDPRSSGHNYTVGVS